MTQHELYSLIQLPPEAVRQLEAVRQEIDWTQAAPCLDGLLDGNTAPSAYCQLKALLLHDEGHFQLLYCYLECARRAFDRYQERHIPSAVYTATMGCFSRFLAECKTEYGWMYFDRGWWTYRQISMSLFRISTLEYELCAEEGKPVICLHIPSDADLSSESVDDSLKQASSFFEAYAPDYEKSGRYTCDSWLLSPVLRELLPETSRIVAFQKRFQLTRTQTEGSECIGWIFQRPLDTEIRELPENTTLQRRAKALLLAGGSIGSGCGVIESGRNKSGK